MSRASGYIGNSTYVCQYPTEILSVNSRGMFLGDNPFHYAVPLLLLQLSVIALTTYFTNFCLRPLGQSSVVSQILAGIILGPSFLGSNTNFSKILFPRGSHSTLETVATFGVMFFLFQMGVKSDPGLIKQSGRKSILIGVLAFVFPFAFGLSYALIMQHFVEMDKSLAHALPMIASSQAITGFIVIASHLTEIKMINTDIGRLAVSAAMVADLMGICATVLSLALQQSQTDPVDALLGLLSTLGMAGVIVFLIRPVALWIIKQTPVGEPVKEVHIFSLFVAILGVGIFSEAIGQHFVLGPLLLGVALPDGPPLGAELVEKLESFVTLVLFPTYLTVSGLKTDIFAIRTKSSWIVGTVVVFAFVIKVMAAMLPCLYTNMPWRDSLVLGLTLNTKGIVELLLYNIWKDAQILTEQEFALTIVTVLSLTAVISPIMRLLYDPSKRFVSSKRNTIQHAKHNAELRILVCLHRQESVPSIINILEISHPTEQTPIGVVVLQLVELVGRSAPILVPHQSDHNFLCGGSRTQNIVNAFKQYELQNPGLTNIEPFTAIAHLSTMHDDICNLSFDKKVNFVITPFHMEWAIDGQVGSENHALRTMNCNLLESAPCSVGIFIDRNILSGSLTILTSRAFYRVAVLFMGGADDGEALAYGGRMAEHPQVNLTVIRFLAFGGDNARERKLDNDTIQNFKVRNGYNKQIKYKDEVVKDQEGLAKVIRELGNGYDLVMVGKYHKNENRLLSGLSAWNECPELGIIGDMLASPDFKGMCSVLVIQQAKIRPGMQTREPNDVFNHEDNGPQSDGTLRISVER